MIRYASVALLLFFEITSTEAAEPVPVPMTTASAKNLVSWDTLSKVKTVKADGKIRPEFSKGIEALNQQEVRIQGYMVPLEPGEKQKHFLLSANSPSCDFCLPAGPEGIVEITSKSAIKFSFEPVVVSGKMDVMKDDAAGLYYRIVEATPAAAAQAQRP